MTIRVGLKKALRNFYQELASLEITINMIFQPWHLERFDVVMVTVDQRQPRFHE